MTQVRQREAIFPCLLVSERCKPDSKPGGKRAGSAAPDESSCGYGYGCGYGSMNQDRSADHVARSFASSHSSGWGIAVGMAVFVCGGISGHINPAVTLSLALFRKFPWKKVPGYILAQILGATCGALFIYGMYHVPILQIDPAKTQATAQYFTTYPADFIRSSGTRLVGM